MEQNLCKYFNNCGGCQIQGLNRQEYFDKKLNNLKQILDTKNITYENLEPLLIFPIGIRRRANLKIDFGCNIGFYKKNSNDVVAIKNCQMLDFEINNIIKYLPLIFKTFVKRSDGNILITKVENGITLDFENINITPLDLPKLKKFAEKFNIIRIANRNEILYENQTPFIVFNDIKVPYSSNSFLQPSQNGENAITETIKKFIGSNKLGKVADLFCGLGIFSFYLKDIAEQIYSFDCDEDAIRQINKISKQHNLKINAKSVDLFTHPLSSEKLNQFDLIVLDPPRDGAKVQIEKIVKSSVKNIIYVSCNPITFVRDCRILLDNGYKIRTIQPIDQFANTNHLELVANIYK
jgi:23S rRNA (uracil1939-C5)-methyltransferase